MQKVKFSNGGHLFAAANKGVVQVYMTYNQTAQANVLKGHSGPVTDLNWAHSDQRLVSCSIAGEVYEWKMDTMTRDTVHKNCQCVPSFSPQYRFQIKR